MPSFAAFLGHQPHISIAELSASVPDFKLQTILNNEVILFESTKSLDEAYLNTLGGTVVIARKLSEDDLTLEDVPKLLSNEVENIKGKVTFSIRAYHVSPKIVKNLYRDLKQHLKKEGHPSRYVGTDHVPAPSIVLHTEGIIDGTGGAEIVIIRNNEDLWIGKTVAAQNVTDYTKRDMNKPVRDTTVGLLPPKLAQVLLNLGAWLVHEHDMKKMEQPLTVLDPFCGTGVIPMECLLRAWPVYASDVSLKAVNGTEKNLEWLRKEKKILKKDVQSTVWKHDAQKPFELKDKPDMIVTETSLGPNLEGRPPIKDVLKLKTENEHLQMGFLKTAASSLPGVPIACMWPVWYHSKGAVHLEKTWEKLKEIGYEAVLPPGTQGEAPNRPTLVYRRPGQFVGREIVLLRPLK